jgi:transketolase
MTDPKSLPDWVDATQATADRIRLRVFEHVLHNGEGYLSQACSSAELFALLYTRALRIAPLPEPLHPGPFPGVPGPGNSSYATGAAYNGAPAPDRDRFIFSPSHYALVLYATLIEVGRLAPNALDAFNRDGSTLEMIGAEHSPGVELTTGSLAQALSQAAGIALARRMRGDAGRVVVFMSDGEFEEGQTWEALAAAAFHGLDNLRVLIDANGQQCDGRVATVACAEPMADRIRAFGATVDEVDGHDLVALDAALARRSAAPHVILARTDPVRCIPILGEKAPLLHTLRFASPEEKARYQEVFETMRAEVAGR